MCAEHLPRILLIVSDLHLSKGWDAQTKKIDRLEDFFFDMSFERFLNHHMKKGSEGNFKVRLIIAGDFTDFLQVLGQPEGTNMVSESITQREEYYGLGTSPQKSCWKLWKIMHGHPIFFRAFFNFLSQGNEIVIIPGNHDIEFAIPEVQHCFRNALLHLILDEDKNKSNISDVINRNLFFLPWFYYEPGLLYVEHGHQYDSLNSFEYFLHPLTPDNLIDLPAGSFFVRYLFNKVESDYPFADNMKPVSRFIWWLLVRILKGGLFLTKRVRSQLYHYLDFFWQTINKAGPLPPKWIPELEKLQRQAIHRIANDTGIAEEKLLSIKNMWAKSDIHHLDKLNLVLRFFRDDPNNDFYFKFFEKIRDILEVQYIVFGHTHEADLQLLGSPDQAAKGINSGTWTKVFAENYEERLLQDENELVFVKIDRLGPQMELMRWRDDLDEGQRVRLFEAPDGQVLKTNLSAS